MIYILIGDDLNNKSKYIKELTKDRESFFVQSNILDKNTLLGYSSNYNLFGESQTVVLENFFSEKLFDLSLEELNILKDSETIFAFKEDKMTAIEQKKYKKYAEIEIFENKKKIIDTKFNVFSITDAFASRDKISTWVLYNKAIEEGVEPEAISGVLFWKIKSLLLNGSRVFSKEELKKQSSCIVSLSHKAHRGECDFSIGLEQFILSSLSSK